MPSVTSLQSSILTSIAEDILIGLDWANQKHDLHLYEVSTGLREVSILENKAEAIHEWVASLRLRYPDQKIAIALEQKRGPLIYALCKYDFLVLYPLNPRMVARYRQAFAPGSAAYRKLAELVEKRRVLVGEKVRLTNRIAHSNLKCISV